MDFSGQINKLFKAPKRPHSPTAELSVKHGTGRSDKDFAWHKTNIPCQAACPAGTDIPAYLTAMAEGDPERAYRINLRDNVFPAILGRVCSRPCESACRHAYEGLGESVAICHSKRATDDLRAQTPILLEPWFPPSGKRVAIIGSGVAGLTVARNLTLSGHRVSLYEKNSIPGGMLNQGIPEFRLPRTIIDREVQQILQLGIEMHCNTEIGKEITISNLLNQNDAVVMSAGTQKPNLLNLPGHDLKGIQHGLDFLQEVNQTGQAKIGKRIMVIGGGFTAMDCARTAQRLGAETAQLTDEWTLKVLYRRSENHLRVTPGELTELHTEGIPLECQATPLAYLGKEGKVCGMRFKRTDTDDEFELEADMILLATGQFPDLSWIDGDIEKQPAAHERLFMAGDFAQGASSLIEAIAHAKETAIEIDTFLMGGKRTEKQIHVEDAKSIPRTDDMNEIPVQPMPARAISERDLPSEVELGYTQAAATAEANRCYRCHYKFEIDQDKCIKCDWCLKAKPRPECILMLKSIQHDQDGRTVSWEATNSVREMKQIWINQDECIRCGACIKACPVDAIDLQKVSLCTTPLTNDYTSKPEN